MTERNDSQRALLVTLDIKIRTYDIDFAGIVSNIAYIRWLEDLRLSLLETYYPLEKMMKDGTIPILQMTHIEYKRPIKMFDKVSGCLWMDSLDSDKWTARAEICINDTLASSATQSGTFLSVSTMKKTTVPPMLKKIYDEY